MKSRDFIHAVWAQQGVGYGFICIKYRDQVGPGSWEDIPIHFPNQKIIVPDPSEGDIYFTPNLFTRARRNKNNMAPSRWLYADLDEIDPFTVKEEWEPGVSWLSSHNRFQGLWLVSRPLPPEIHQKINRQLSYALGADKSGWDATQVLRVPGTLNYKYDPPQDVQFLYFTEDVLHKIKLPRLAPLSANGVEPYDFDYKPELHNDEEVLRNWDGKLPLGMMYKLRSVVVPTGDRSRVLFRFECALIEIGLKLEEVYGLLRVSVWNKFDTDADLIADIMRAREYIGRKK